jgi:putative DNA primase/helicase
LPPTSQSHDLSKHPAGDAPMTTATKANVTEIKRAIATLFKPGDVVELRALGVQGRIHAGYFNDFARLAIEAARLSGQATGVYVVLNQIEPALLARSVNRITTNAKDLTQDKYITRRHWLFIDVDAKRPKGISSTDAEHEAAIATAKAIKSYLIEIGLPANSIIVADSGNGAHLLIKIDLPNDKELEELIKSCLRTIEAKFNSDAVEIDQTVFNASRICKLAGTMACKGDSTADRPWRIAMVLDVPDSIATAPAESIQSLAALAPAPETPKQIGRSYHGSGQQFDLELWLSQKEIIVFRKDNYEGGYRYILRECPFNSLHTGTSSAVFQGADGKIGFKCQHNECSGRGWSELRELLEPGYKEHKEQYPENRNYDHKQAAGNSYIVIDKRGNSILDIAKLTVDIMTKAKFAFMRDNDTGFYYDVGVYKENAERYIAAECQQLVGITPILTEHKITEIIGHIRRTNYHDRKEFNPDPNIINVKNGLLNIITGLLAPHTPDYLSNVQNPVEYNPQADCPAIKQFLIDIHNSEDIPTMQELFGYLLLRDYRIQKSFLGVGGGENGKSTEQRLIEAFLGKENCSHKSWQQLENNRFASSALEGKLVNLFADLPSKGVDTTTTFKMLTGSDGIDAEKKFKDSYSFDNFAKLIFSTNKPPKVEGEDSYAFWRRWIILEYPRQFTDADKKPNILQDLTTPAELSGLLNYALEGLKRLLVNNKFTYSKSVEDVTEYYMKASDPVYAFGSGDKCELDSNATVSKDDLYDAFKDYCEQNKMPILKPNAFARALQNQVAFHVRATKTTIDGVRVPAWQGIKLQDPKSKNVRVVRDVHDNSHIKRTSARAVEQLKMQNNTDNPDNPDNELPDCPICGRNEWEYTAASKLKCPCGHIADGDDDHDF